MQDKAKGMTSYQVKTPMHVHIRKYTPALDTKFKDFYTTYLKHGLEYCFWILLRYFKPDAFTDVHLIEYDASGSTAKLLRSYLYS